MQDCSVSSAIAMEILYYVALHFCRREVTIPLAGRAEGITMGGPHRILDKR